MHIIFKYSGMLTKTDHILGHETNLNKLKRTEIIQDIFSDHSGIKLQGKKLERNVGEKPKSSEIKQ